MSALLPPPRPVLVLLASLSGCTEPGPEPVDYPVLDDVGTICAGVESSDGVLGDF